MSPIRPHARGGEFEQGVPVGGVGSDLTLAEGFACVQPVEEAEPHVRGVDRPGAVAVERHRHVRDGPLDRRLGALHLRPPAGLWIGLDGDRLLADFQVRVSDATPMPTRVFAKSVGGRPFKLPKDVDRLPVFDLGVISPTPELTRRLEESDDPVGLLHTIEAEQRRSGIPFASP